MKGNGFKFNLLIGIVLIFALSAFFLFPGSAVTSSGGNYTVTPDNIYLNWTGDTINVTSNLNTSFYTVNNMSTLINPVYFDEDKYSANDYSGYDSVKMLRCFNNGMTFTVQNSTGSYTNVTVVLNQTNSTTMDVTTHQYCPPGYYAGKFNVTRNGTTEYANITAYVNIPVNPQNTFNETGSRAFVKGNMTADSNVIHKYYFNTSLVDNITGVTINLSWGDYSEDIGLYLFDSSGNLLERSLENHSRGEIYTNLPGTSDLWEIWIYGNVSSLQNYVANMYFTTLNVSDTDSPDQKITSLDFGNLDPENDESGSKNITLSNVDTKVWTGIKEISETYRVETWESKSQPGDYYFVVPSYATKVKAKMEWTGETRWFISLNDSSGNFIGNSSKKYRPGSKTDTVQEEHVIYSGSLNSGVWKLSVGNLSAISDDKYNITVYVWNPSGWVTSDFPSSFDFQSAGSANSMRNVSLRISLPESNFLNGTYEGFVEYYKPSGWTLQIPVSFSVKSGNLLVNDTFGSVTEIKYDNIGFNRLGSGVIQITLPINNTGGHDVYFVSSTYDNALKKNPYYMNVSVDWPANPIPAGSSDTLKINISINTSNPGTANSPGLYTGWVRMNTTNSTNASSSSYPSKVLTVNLNVDLASTLKVSVNSIKPDLVKDPSTNHTNMTLNISVKLANGTIVSTEDYINQTNFYNVYLEEANTSYKSSTTLGNLTNSEVGGPWSFVCTSGYNECRLNGTLAPGKPGGRYYAHASVKLNTSVFGGTGTQLTGTNRSYTKTAINDEGLMITDYDDIDVLEGYTKYYEITVTNFGPLGGNEIRIKFDKGDCPIIVSTKNSTCNDDDEYSSSTWEFDLSGYSSCKMSWNVKGGTVSSDTDCDGVELQFVTNLSSDDNYYYYDNRTIDVDVANNATTGGDENGDVAPPLGCSSNSSCADDRWCDDGVCVLLSCKSGWYADDHKCKEYEKELEITDYTSKIYIMQGGENSTQVTVKNTGDVTITTKLNVSSNLTGLEMDVSPSSYSLKSGKSGVFDIDFSVTNTTEVGYHKITLKAYAKDYSDVYATKEITLGVSPLEETKREINETYDELKDLFVTIVSQFNQIPPTSAANYTIANRTYHRLLNMLSDVEDKIKAGNYLDAYSILKDTNSSLASFRQEVEQLMVEMGQLPFGNVLMLVAILVVIVVIGGFLVYLLLPPKRGYHPSLGYLPGKKISVLDKFKNLFSHIGKIKHIGRGQQTLAQYEKQPVPFGKQAPSPPLPQRPPEKKTYMTGYDKQRTFEMAYKKREMKKKKLLGK